MSGADLTNSSRGEVRAGIRGGGGCQGPQKGNSVGILIPSKIYKKIGRGGGVKSMDPSLDLIRDQGSDSKLWGDFC